MREATTSPAAGANASSAATPPPATDPGVPPATEPPRRRTSRRLRELQRWERRSSKAAHRLAKAVERGVATYRKERDRSALERRDGALRDWPANLAEGLAETLREASRVPLDLARGIRGKQVLRAMRDGARLMFFPFVR